MKRLARMPKTTSQPFHVPERPPSTENITQQVSHPAVETHCALGFCFNCGVDVVYDCLSFGHIWQPCFHIDCCVVRYACCSLLCHFVGVRYLFGTSGWFFLYVAVVEITLVRRSARSVMGGYGLLCGPQFASCTVIAHYGLGCGLVVSAMECRQWHSSVASVMLGDI